MRLQLYSTERCVSAVSHASYAAAVSASPNPVQLVIACLCSSSHDHVKIERVTHFGVSPIKEKSEFSALSAIFSSSFHVTGLQMTWRLWRPAFCRPFKSALRFCACDSQKTFLLALSSRASVDVNCLLNASQFTTSSSKSFPDYKSSLQCVVTSF